ncbi:hypothetical protein FRB96_000206 [Tulasnella sp. 330]|nr:hypothetical protein FRB96_000206 [Tulasnella sp. 330]KAG8886478.1 hypothetical protein FRB97_002989 [Tulasnella sp. 331]KAG8891109.1 hypothetical protein FRB98_000118 [Tulasnella sp. 332]
MGIRKRKLPITAPSERGKRHKHAAISTPKPQSTRNAITKFHNALKHKAAILSLGDPSLLNAHDARKLKEIDTEIARMGGLELYQDMSATGQRKDRGGGSEKVLINWLKELEVTTMLQGLQATPSVKGKGKAESEMESTAKLSLLEVGALEPDNYGSCSSWIDSHPIDLRSRHPGIRKQDFMLLDKAVNCAKWDIISLSLVLNFVGDAHDRGTAQEARLLVDAL